MATFNDYPVTLRYNRPSVEGVTMLEHYHINGGTYQTPYFVSSVHIFPDYDGSPDRYLDFDSGSERYGLIKETSLLDAVATFEHEPSEFLGYGDGLYGEGDYTPSSLPEIGKIFFKDNGNLAVILDGATTNSPSAIGNYFDIWTMWDFAQSKPVVHIHSFSLYNDTVISTSEPLSITLKSKLLNKYIKKGSAVNVKIENEFFLNNKNLSNDIKNIFKDSVVVDPAIRIKKIMPNSNTEPFEVIIDGEDITRVTSDNTLLYFWDTTNEYGTYTVQASFWVLNEFFKTEEFTLVVK